MSAQEAVIRFRVNPRSSRTQVTGMAEGVLQIKLSAPPVDGEANKALVEYLSKTLKVPKSAITIKTGAASRSKTVVVSGISQERADSLLEELIRR